MKAWAGLGAGGRAVVSVAGVGAVAVAGVLASGWWPESGGEAKAPPAAVAADVAAPADVAAAPALAAEIAAPVITTWAVAPGGHATIGGLGDPDAQILVLLDGAEIDATRVTRGGEFALVTRFAPNPNPSILSLVMVLEDGRRIVSKEVVAIGPVPGGEAPGPEVAAAEAAPAGEAPVAADTNAADTPPVALKITEEGAVLLQPAAAEPEAGAVTVAVSGPEEAPVLPVVVQTISYGSPEIVQIGGSGAPGAFVRLYLDTKPVGPADVAISADGRWQVEIGDIAAGTYLLRVDQLDAEGKVTSRFETPFRRETPAALAALAGEAELPAEATSEKPAETPVPAAPVAEPAEIIALAGAAPEVPIAGPTPDAQEPAEPAAAPLPAPPVQPAISITVQPGHTLWAIAREEFGEGVLYVQLFEANRDRIRDPDLIYPGQVFTIPGR